MHVVPLPSTNRSLRLLLFSFLPQIALFSEYPRLGSRTFSFSRFSFSPISAASERHDLYTHVSEKMMVCSGDPILCWRAQLSNTPSSRDLRALSRTYRLRESAFAHPLPYSLSPLERAGVGLVALNDHAFPSDPTPLPRPLPGVPPPLLPFSFT